MMKTILKTLWDYSKQYTFLYILTGFLSYFLPFLFLYILSNGVIFKEDISTSVFVVFIGLPIFLYLNNIYSLYLEKVFSRFVCEEYLRILNKTNQTQNLNIMERLSARDLNILLDNIQNSLALVYSSLFLLTIIIFFSTYLGHIAPYYLILCFILGVISYYVSKISDANFSNVLEMLGKRIELTNNWFRVGFLIKQFFKNPVFSHKFENEYIAQILEQEQKYRNLDTMYQSLNKFIIYFGRLLIYALIIIFAINIDDSELVVILWLSLPTISLIFSFPSYYIGYKNANRSLQNIQNYKSSTIDVQEDNPVQVEKILTFNDDLDIYPGKLIDLIPHDSSNATSSLAEILTIFRFIPELGNNADEVLNKKIELNANNLSQGQKLRLQIIRQYYLAKSLDVKFKLTDDLNALDINLALRIKDFLIDHKVEIAEIILQNLAARAANMQNTKEDEEVDSSTSKQSGSVNNVESKSYSFLIFFIISFLLILPATLLLSYSTNFSFQTLDLSRVLSYFVLGLLLGIVGSLLIENNIRKKFSNLFLSRIDNVLSNDMNNIQVGARDLTTIFERISWYTLDISWLISLFSITLISVALGFKLIGIILFLVFFILLFILYRCSIEKVTQSRILTIAGFNDLMEATQTSYSIDQIIKKSTLTSNFFREHKEKTNQARINNFNEARIQALINKSFVSYTASLVSYFFIVVIALWSYFTKNFTTGIIAITSLQIIRHDITNVFLAIIGFKSQSVSIDRLMQFVRVYEPITLVSTKDDILIPEFDTNQIRYKDYKLSKNNLHVLHGDSGSGKSTYLKAIANITKSQNIKFNDVVASSSNTVSVYYS